MGGGPRGARPWCSGSGWSQLSPQPLRGVPARRPGPHAPTHPPGRHLGPPPLPLPRSVQGVCVCWGEGGGARSLASEIGDPGAPRAAPAAHPSPTCLWPPHLTPGWDPSSLHPQELPPSPGSPWLVCGRKGRSGNLRKSPRELTLQSTWVPTPTGAPRGAVPALPAAGGERAAAGGAAGRAAAGRAGDPGSKLSPARS